MITPTRHHIYSRPSPASRGGRIHHNAPGINNLGVPPLTARPLWATAPGGGVYRAHMGSPISPKMELRSWSSAAVRRDAP